MRRFRLTTWTSVVVLLAAAALLDGSAGATFAQEPKGGLDIQPTQPPEQQGTLEQENQPGPVRASRAPAFITPFVRTVPVSRSSGVRVGLSAWTTPTVPFNSPESTGGVAFGLTLLWAVPLRERGEATPSFRVGNLAISSPSGRSEHAY